MTPSGLIAKALKVWVDERRTGFLLLNFRNGRLKYIEHQQREHLPIGQMSVSQNGQPMVCPACEALMVRREGDMWACPACLVKRTAAQLKG